MIEYILNYNTCALFNGHKHILMWSLPNFFNLSYKKKEKKFFQILTSESI
jgi:hypothetical protein